MTGQQEDRIEIKKSIVINASPEVVFKAITDPNELTNWFPDSAVFSDRIGGQVRFSFYKERSKDMDRDYSPEGIVKEFIPNKKVSYTWQLKDVPGFPETVVTWELEEIDHHRTKVELVHSGFTGKEGGKLSSKEHDQGWSYFLGKLKEYSEKIE
ncbi:MAG TPA: SRPBCC domain-containing protein [Nitrososphaeraceae archaeon]|nr:SRPBCC domain-containing protein [Nitrososphaeraceae archaeon]